MVDGLVLLVDMGHQLKISFNKECLACLTCFN